MAAKNKEKVQYTCQSCGFVSLRWLGKCSECATWNSLVEEKVAAPDRQKGKRLTSASHEPVALSDIIFKNEQRICFASAEFNRVLGGGLIPGSLVLIGGDPGIGKSTLLLQEAALQASEKTRVLYVSGEESNQQIKIRAQRLGADSDHLFVHAATKLDDILGSIAKLKPGLVIVDSIQTVYQPAFESAPGSISQVRECALAFMAVAKAENMPVILVGHVTKEGFLAGPKVLEHMVDTLLQFEGDRNQLFRILRAGKNRFGSTREIGIFEMREQGLQDVENPSSIFLAERTNDISGSVVISTIEGTRPILVEVQALATTTNYGMPQRTATGFDAKKLSLIIAVLEKRIGLRLGSFDVFLNVVGGVRIDEPAADFGVAVAIASSVKNASVPGDTVLIGEVGLAGEIRMVPHLDKRIHEASKLGFSRALVPGMKDENIVQPKNFRVTQVRTLEDALQTLF